MIREDDKILAEGMANELLREIDNRRAIRRRYLRALEIYSADVEEDVDRFRQQLRLHWRHKFPVPCVRLEPDETPIPIDLMPTLGSYLFIRGRPPLGSPNFHFILDHINHFLAFEPRLPSLEQWTGEESIDFFRHHLTGFLATRFSARNSDISKKPGLLFTVKTRRHGLRVHYSPAYFFDMSNVFGSPTSPVVSWIQPGRYIFGVQGPFDSSPRVDTGRYDIPPMTEAQLVVS